MHALFMDARFPDNTYVNDGRLGLGSNNAQVDIGGFWLPRVSPYTFNYSLSQLIFTEIGKLRLDHPRADTGAPLHDSVQR